MKTPGPNGTGVECALWNELPGRTARPGQAAICAGVNKRSNSFLTTA